MKSEESGAGFVAGFVLGAVVGAALALWMTPRSGEEARDILSERGIELRGRAGEVVAKAKDEADDLLTRGKTALEEQRARVQEAVTVGRDAAAQKKAELLAKYRVAKETGETPIEEVTPAEDNPETA